MTALGADRLCWMDSNPNQGGRGLPRSCYLHFRFLAPAGCKQANVPRGVAANICGIERHQAMSSDDPQVLIEAAKQRDKRFPSGTGLFQAKRPEFK